MATLFSVAFHNSLESFLAGRKALWSSGRFQLSSWERTQANCEPRMARSSSQKFLFILLQSYENHLNCPPLYLSNIPLCVKWDPNFIDGDVALTWIFTICIHKVLTHKKSITISSQPFHAWQHCAVISYYSEVFCNKDEDFSHPVYPLHAIFA